MSILYNPKKQNAQPWVFIFFVVIPLIFFTVIIIVGKGIVDKKATQEKTKTEEDVFDRF